MRLRAKSANFRWLGVELVMVVLAGCTESALTPTVDAAASVDATDVVVVDLGATVDAGVAKTPDTGPAVVPIFEGECGQCMAAECAAVHDECAGDPDCRACVGTHDEEACHRTEETHGRSDAVLVCQADHCSDRCLTPDAGADGGLQCVGVSRGACGECLAENCCGQVARCRANDVCFRCVTTGNEAVCHSEPAGHALAHAFWACAGACNAACSTPRDAGTASDAATTDR